MIKTFLCLLLSFSFSAIANIDGVIDDLYNNIDTNVLNQIFINKKSAKDMLVEIDREYRINLEKTNNIKELNFEMQKKLVRGRGIERVDLNVDKKNLCRINIFNSEKSLKKQNISNLTPVVLGATFSAMKSSISEVLKTKQTDKLFILVSDRPFTVEDFFEDNDHKILYDTLCKKNSKYKDKYKEINNIASDYQKNNIDEPFLKRLLFYYKLVSLIDIETGEIGLNLFNNLVNSIKKNGIKSKQTLEAMIKCKEFLYTKEIELLPTEKDLAEYIFEEHNFKNVVYIYTKTKFKRQDRATTIDTYIDFIEYIKDNKIDTSKLILVNVGLYPYRQWFEFINMLDKSYILPKFGYVAKEDCVADDIFVDEFARLFYDFNKQINIKNG